MCGNSQRYYEIKEENFMIPWERDVVKINPAGCTVSCMRNFRRIVGDGEVYYPISSGDIIELSATTSNSPKNDNRTLTVDKYISFRNI
jgi:hypothetical protein